MRGRVLPTKLGRSLAIAVAIVVSNAVPALAKIHPGDHLSVLVYNHPELSGQAVVDDAGFISLPLAGGVDTKNLDPAQISAQVRARLAPYVRKAAVDVQLLSQGQSLFVSGGPVGVLAYSPGENLSGAIAQLETANVSNTAIVQQPGTQTSNDLEHGRVDLHRVSVLRDGRDIGPFDATSDGPRGRDTLLQSGDTIAFHDKPVAVEVRGDVKLPGKAYLYPSDSESVALAEVGGELPTASDTAVILERDGVSRRISRGSAEFSEPAKPGDVVIVPRAPTITVVGMVVKPGTVVLKNDTTLLSALYGADGIQKWADLKKVQILRHGEHTQYDVTRLTHGDVSQNPPLADGDTVFVPEGHKIDWTPVFAALGLGVNFGTRFVPQRVTP